MLAGGLFLCGLVSEPPRADSDQVIGYAVLDQSLSALQLGEMALAAVGLVGGQLAAAPAEPRWVVLPIPDRAPRS
jgi:hypothetical protein